MFSLPPCTRLSAHVSCFLFQWNAAHAGVSKHRAAHTNRSPTPVVVVEMVGPFRNPCVGGPNCASVPTRHGGRVVASLVIMREEVTGLELKFVVVASAVADADDVDSAVDR